MGLSTKGPITPWQGSWAQQQQTGKYKPAYSPLHGCVVQRRSDRPDLLLPKERS